MSPQTVSNGPNRRSLGNVPDLLRIGQLVLFALVLSACQSPAEYKEETDAEVYSVLERARLASGQEPDPEFNIDRKEDETNLRAKFVLARADESMPTPAERLSKSGVEVQINLAKALGIAARNSRDFQDQKEFLYDSALSYTDQAHRFESEWFGIVDLGAAALGDGGSDSSLQLSEGSSLGFTRLLERGGAFSLSIGNDLTRFLTNPASTVATSFINMTLSLPLLRGSGREIAFESVTQAEWNVIYAVRSFERFKRSFAVDISTSYLGLLRDLQTIENQQENYRRRQTTAKENRALGEAGRLAVTDVERANQAELAAENSLISAKQRFADNLDRFKLQLGLPADAMIRIDPNDLNQSLGKEVSIQDEFSEQQLLLLGLGSRLDLLTSEGRVQDARRRAKVAADALLARVDFNASANLGSANYAERSFKLDPIGDGDYILGFDVDLPFDQHESASAYRSALIDHEAARRSLEESEDNIKLQIRRGLRALIRSNDSYRIQQEALKVAEVNVDSAEMLKAAGEGTTLDLLDAQGDLNSAQNAVLGALIDFRVSRLQLLRDLGVLTVGRDGLDAENTERLLLQGRSDDE